MIDPVQIPVLLKAIDFVFEEGRKILEERRERRKLNAPLPQSEDRETENEPAPINVQAKDGVKQDLISSKIDELLWKNHEMEVQHLVRLLETFSNNYRLAREQYAKWGSALVPPIIMHNMTDAENSVIETTKQLEIVLSKIYNKDINPNK